MSAVTASKYVDVISLQRGVNNVVSHLHMYMYIHYTCTWFRLCVDFRIHTALAKRKVSIITKVSLLYVRCYILYLERVLIKEISLYECSERECTHRAIGRVIPQLVYMGKHVYPRKKKK